MLRSQDAGNRDCRPHRRQRARSTVSATQLSAHHRSPYVAFDIWRQSAAQCAPGCCRRRVAGSRLLCRLLAPRAEQSATSARTSSHGTISRASATVGAVHSPIGDQQILRSVIRSIPSSGHRYRRSSSPQGAPRSQRRSARRLPISRRASSPSQNREWTISRSRGVARTGNPAAVEGLR